MLPFSSGYMNMLGMEKWCGFIEKEYQCPELISRLKENDERNKRL
jgi:hypothetical protein